MNFIAHVHVAMAVVGGHPSADDIAFGAALPDLVSMARVRLDRSGLPELVNEGVELHHRTDSVFHSRPEFRSGLLDLTAQLKSAGLAVGPSRAVGHTGWELLLDGCLLKRPGVVEEFAEMLDRAPDVAEAVAPEDPERWRGLLAQMESERWWLGYTDAATVALRLHRMLRSRRRLAFGSEDIPMVSEVLWAAKPSIEFVADQVIAGVVSAVAPRPNRGAVAL